jgi:RNA polymerase sigma-70 factor (ECF subfamily)
MTSDPSHASEDAPGQVTRLLRRASSGDELAERELYGQIYEQLHGMARMYMSKQGAAVTLQPTALVNEAWLRLARSENHYDDRTHFLRVASCAMRSTLVDEARRRASKKRGGGATRVPLEVAVDLLARGGTDLIALDDALERLGSDEPRQAKIVELRFFGGLTLVEVAKAVGSSLATVERDWSLARIWLREELRPESS